ncbi:MAG TPA: amidohydrolase family protein [Candidatus Polarisedimenticolaceae bacterium]|nr:amidohydrolase family protein [Candidatus Polarisedimenticolaceae bacterium]
MKMLAIFAVSIVLSTCALAADLAEGLKPYVKVQAKRVVLAHVRVIDGTGKPAIDDRNVTIENGKIASIAPGADLASSSDTTVLDMKGKTVLPGLVGMHDHMYYVARPNLDATGHSEDPLVVPQMTFSAPRLYLANGVTTIRTTGSVEGFADINLRDLIDAGQLLGPHMDVTAPYLQGKSTLFMQMYQLKDADDARRFVDFWADAGATSFKAYMHITRAELKAAADEAHKRHLKITGHLCSVTYPEAIEAGIDDLEHGFMVNTDGATDKKPDECPIAHSDAFIDRIEPDGSEAKALIDSLVAHHVAITSTMPVFENRMPNRPPLNPKAMDSLTTEARTAYMYARNRAASQPAESAARVTRNFQRGLAMEHAFAKAGGLLLAGCDPTGNGGTIPGFADLREVELLVEAGFTPAEAIRVATLNGAIFLGRDKTIGSIEAGKDADLFVVGGDPSTKIGDINNVEIVFKDGIGFDTAKLLESVKGRYGQY